MGVVKKNAKTKKKIKVKDGGVKKAKVSPRKEEKRQKTVKKIVKKKLKEEKTGTFAEKDIVTDNLEPTNDNMQMEQSSMIEETKVKPLEKKSRFKYVPIENNSNYHGVLLLQKSEEVAVLGYFLIQVLRGTVVVNGYQQNAGQPDLPVYSLPSSSLFTLVESSDRENNTTEALKFLEKNKIPGINVNKKELLKEKCVTIVLLKKLRQCGIKFLSNLKHHDHILIEDIQIFSQANCPYVTLESDCWKNDADKIEKATKSLGIKSLRLLISGATDLGKSSFGRYIINRILTKYQETSLFYLDCDLGQSEFTPPGCISLTEVKSPLLGPPFTHLRKPVRCQFYGDVTPKDRPYFYTDCIYNVFKYYLDHFQDSGPLVVNTQGWVKGLGQPLLIDVLRIVKPNVTVQFTSQTNLSKRMISLSDQVVKSRPGWGYQPESSDQSDSSRSLTKKNLYLDIAAFEYDNENINKLRSKLPATEYRRLALLAYFSDMEKKSYENYLERCQNTSGTLVWKPRSFEKLIPYQVFLKDVAVHVPGVDPEKEFILRTLNYSVVALAKVEETVVSLSAMVSDGMTFLTKFPLCECLGYGLVRNVDVEKEILYILTPEPLDIVQNVNALLKAAISIPSALFDQSKAFYSTASDVTAKVQEILGAKALKPRFNLLRKGQGFNFRSDYSPKQ